MLALSSVTPSVLPASMVSRPIVVAIDPGMDALPLPEPDLWCLSGFDDVDPLVTVGADGPIQILRDPPTLPVAIATEDPSGRNVVKFLDWLTAHGAPRLPPVIEWRRGTEKAALRRIAAELEKLSSASAARERQVAAEVQRLRTVNAELEHHRALAEYSLQRRGAVPFELAFANEPVADASQCVMLSDFEAGVSQILPLGSVGVAAVAVHFENAGEPGTTGHLQAALVGLEDGVVLEQWVIPSASIRSGWNMLALPSALAGLNRTLQLRLGTKDTDRVLPALSLGGAHPIPSFQLSDVATGRPCLVNSLAIQVWRSIPSAALPGSISAHLPSSPRSLRGGFVDVQVARSALESAEHANSDTVTFDFPAVQAPPGEGEIVCHPPGRGVTVGRVPDVPIGNAVRVSAVAYINNEKSKDIDFGIIVATDLERARYIVEGRSTPGRREAFSGWCRINHGETRRIDAFRDGGNGDHQSLFIATRMSDPGDNSYAWARFRDFRLLSPA